MGLAATPVKVGHSDIVNGWSYGPNSAGGVSVKGTIANTGTKTIKYLTLFFIPYNQVGDAVSCSIKRCSEYGLKCTGPIAPNSRFPYLGENMWYNHSITSVKLSKAKVEYMDGSTETISASDIGGMESYSGGGCYVATAVYGSYDCPQVWTLRRYRDHTLAETWYGRAFIRTYYAVSPTLVKWFGNTKWFKNLWKPRLDRLVEKLNQKGVDDSPYQDKDW